MKRARCRLVTKECARFSGELCWYPRRSVGEVRSLRRAARVRRRRRARIRLRARRYRQAERLPGDDPFPGRTGSTRCRTRAAEFVRASGEAGGASAATIQVTIGAVPVQHDRGSLVRHSSSVIRLTQPTVGTRRRFPFFWCTAFEAAQRAAHDVVAARRCPQRCDWQTREHPSWEHCWDVLNSPLLSPDSGADAAVMAGGGRPERRMPDDQPRMKSSTSSRAVESSYCTGGLFMK